MCRLSYQIFAAVLVVLWSTTIAIADAGPFPDLPTEPTYASACANWTPLVGQCTVLAAKNSRAKFISTMGGGVHTVYVSQALGDCPLLPSPKQLLPHLDEGVQLLIGTGTPPDFRMAPRDDVKQRLADGCLPIVATRWSSPDKKLFYDQLAFVRLIGNRMEAVKGDENSAVYVRVWVVNTSETAQQADLWLSVTGSTNGQDRAQAAYEYLSPLRLGQDRMTCSDGRLRVLWRAPKGATVDAHVREQVAVAEAYGDSAKNPVPGHEPDKTLDKLFATYWAPTLGKLTEPAGIGVRFPQPRWVKQISLWYRGGNCPAYDGQTLQYYDGTKWIDIQAAINGNTADAYAKDPTLISKIGETWTYTFTPVRASAIRVMISKMIEGRPYPNVNSIEYVYSQDYDASANTGKWIDTASGDPLIDYVHFTFQIPPKGKRQLVVITPFLPASPQETAWLEKSRFDSSEAAVTAYWQKILHEGAQVHLPEKVPQEVWNVNVTHMLTSAYIDPTDGLAILPCSVGWYDAVWGNLAAAEIMGLDMRGYHKDAARYLDAFLKWQGAATPPGNFDSKKGFLSSSDEYTWVRWTSNHGWLLWVLSDHYLYTHDKAWLDRVLPNILAACDWIQRERARTKVDAKDGTRPPEWGLPPPGVTGDGAIPCYSFPTDAYTWAGLNAAAHLLREIHHPRAAEITADVNEYRQCILRAAQWAADHTPPYKLTSGKEVPLVPIDLYNSWKISNENQHPWWLDVGPLHLVDCGVVDPKSQIATDMIEVAEDHWLEHGLAIAEPWYAPQRAIYLGRDQINQFLNVYYNELAEGVDRQTYAPVEGHGGVQNLPWADGEDTRFVRMMLVQEEGNSLALCQATPRAWLEQGKTISVKRLPTEFGPLSFGLTSDVDHGKITAWVDAPAWKAVPIRLRIRRPDALPIKSVRLNGKDYTGYKDEWISIPAGVKKAKIEVMY